MSHNQSNFNQFQAHIDFSQLQNKSTIDLDVSNKLQGKVNLGESNENMKSYRSVKEHEYYPCRRNRSENNHNHDTSQSHNHNHSHSKVRLKSPFSMYKETVNSIPASNNEYEDYLNFKTYNK